MSGEQESATRPDGAQSAPTASNGASGGLASVVIPTAFATTVAMWAVGYVSHLDFVSLPRFALGLLVLAHLLGTRAAGRRSSRPVRAGVITGVLVSLLNLLVLASLLAEDSRSDPGLVAASIGGFLVSGALLGGVGGFWARRSEPDRDYHPERHFTRVAAVATFLLVVIGGIVTTEEAGLAVPDWPTSFEANMFLLPFSRMVSEQHVYYEHAHRLFGALVGLTTTVLAIFLWVRDRRRWVRSLGVVAFLLVCFQGWLGGYRVRLADAANFEESGLSLALAVTHGVTGQVFFALLVGLASIFSVAWSSGRGGASERRDAERGVTLVLLGGVLVQLLLGALTRHLTRGTWVAPHIGGAVVVAGLALWASVRATSFYEHVPAVRTSGLGLMFLVIVQIFLGFFALVFPQDTAAGSGTSGTLELLVTTAHQATGALVLAAVVVHTVRVWRLVERPRSGPAGEAVAEGGGAS